MYSLVAHLVLTLLADVRRRTAYGPLRAILWMAYQLSNGITTFTLSFLYVGDTKPRSRELVAFWAMFLLHHLGGPDNISAFSLEDNALSRRQVLRALGEVAAAGYGLYKYVYIGGDGFLIAASTIIFILGAYKYLEKAFALWRGNLGNICTSSKKQASNSLKTKRQASKFFTACAGSGSVSGLLIRRGVDNDLDDEEALMVAHDMLLFCKRAMADSSYQTVSPHNDDELDTSRQIFTLKCENMCKVVEMELSLMYDILYTKAAVVHTWFGYIVRLASPPATTAAVFLFGFYTIESHITYVPDLVITYILLLATVLLDTRWLLRALGSTWAQAFLQYSWLHHAVLCTGIWSHIRRVLVSFSHHLSWLQFMAASRSPSSHRRWSGTVPQYNLLRKCTHKSIVCRGYQHLSGHKLSDDVKWMVFRRVKKILRSTYEKADKDEDAYSMKDITTSWGQLAVKRRPENLRNFHLAFGREFQEDILVWHIATQIFLVFWKDQSVFHDKKELAHANAINVLSQYLMFLVAVQPHMLPGLALRSLFVVTLKYLQEEVWGESGDTAGFSSSSSTTRENNLARILIDMKGDEDWGFQHDEASIVSDGANLALELLGADQSNMPELLELVFNVWVDKLLFLATGTSPESHAEQLSYGGSLATIIWIMAQHAVPFQIGQSGPDDDDDEEEEWEEEEWWEEWGQQEIPQIPNYDEEEGEQEWDVWQQEEIPAEMPTEEEGEVWQQEEIPNDEEEEQEEGEQEDIREVVKPYDEPPSALDGQQMIPLWPRDPRIKPTKGDSSKKKTTKDSRDRARSTLAGSGMTPLYTPSIQ
ncbi:hypothetical protein D1007_60242 [Hordeum vulgare]|nr:hypothetical protein D1007_60242 [Hordeum vulgare]